MAFLPWLRQKKQNWNTKKPAAPAPAARPVGAPVGLRNPAVMSAGRGTSSDDMSALNMALLTNAAMSHPASGSYHDHAEMRHSAECAASHASHFEAQQSACHDHGSSSSYDSGSSSSFDSGSSSYDSGSY